MSYEAEEINAEHKDLIHDVAYNWHGDRMATCSSDQYVKVWDEKKGKWTVTASWKAHSASVWKVNWAHPNYGQVLATCSFDRTAAVWEEVAGDSPGPRKRAAKHWVRRANLVDSRTSVTDVKFGPKEQGLQLATCSEEGIIRIYEAPDVLNLSQWTLQHEIQCKLPLSCLDWMHSFNREHLPLIAVGSDDASSESGGKVFLYEYHDGSRKWMESATISNIKEPVHDIAFSPNLARSFHVLGVGSKDVKIIYLIPDTGAKETPTKLNIETVATFDHHRGTVWRVCWNATGNALASCGDDGCVRMFRMTGRKKWEPSEEVLKGDGVQVPTAAEAARTASSFPAIQGMPATTTPSQTARYFKLGSISQPSKDQWH